MHTDYSKHSAANYLSFPAVLLIVKEEIGKSPAVTKTIWWSSPTLFITDAMVERVEENRPGFKKTRKRCLSVL